MFDPHAIADRYLAVWNDSDASRRRELIDQLFTADADYVDPLMSGSGHDGLDAMIAAAQRQFPGHRFVPRGTPEGHNGRIRFSWTLTDVDGAAVALGTDFAVVAADGRLQAVTGFLDPDQAS